MSKFKIISPFSYNRSLVNVTANMSLEEIIADKMLVKAIKKGLEKFGSPRTMSEKGKEEVKRLMKAIPEINLPPPEIKGIGGDESKEVESKGEESFSMLRLQPRRSQEELDVQWAKETSSVSESMLKKLKKHDENIRKHALKDWSVSGQLRAWDNIREANIAANTGLSVQDKETQSFRTRKKSIRRKTQKKKNNKKRGGKKKRTKRRRRKRTKKKGKYNKCVKFFTKRHRVTKKKALNMCRVMFG